MNPEGRPKGIKNFKTVLKKVLDNIEIWEEGQLVDGWDAMSIILIKKALEGDIASIKEVLDRMEGKATQSVELGGQVNVNIAFPPVLKQLV